MGRPVGQCDILVTGTEHIHVLNVGMFHQTLFGLTSTNQIQTTICSERKTKTPISYNNTNAIICKQKNELHSTVLPRRLYYLLRIEFIEDLFCFHNLIV
jgi:hypothetical protein